MISLPKKVVDEFEKLKAESSSRLVLKVIRGNYYVYKERGVWLRDKHRSKTISEYMGKITEEGLFVKKSFHARNDLESAKALIAEHGGEINWHATEKENITETATRNLNTDKIDLSILMSLSMNARLPVSRIAELAGINEQTAYSRIKALEKRLGINYLLEVDVEILGFTTYLIFVKFEGNTPSVEELEKAFKAEPKIQFAVVTKGDYDIVAYLLDENSFKAEATLWKIMSETDLGKYDAKWYMVPFGQYSFVPLRDEFVENILSKRQWHRRRFVTVTPTQEDILKREFILLKELNNSSNADFSDIDKKYNLGRGASRYTYQQLKGEGVITRATITMTKLPLKYIGIFRVETTNPNEVNKNIHELMIEQLHYGHIANKYALAGNTSMPESLTLFIPIMEREELEDAMAPLTSMKGMSTKGLVVTKVLVGSLCYRRFDNTYTRQHSALLRLKKLEAQTTIEYE